MTPAHEPVAACVQSGTIRKVGKDTDTTRGPSCFPYQLNDNIQAFLCDGKLQSNGLDEGQVSEKHHSFGPDGGIGMLPQTTKKRNRGQLTHQTRSRLGESHNKKTHWKPIR